MRLARTVIRWERFPVDQNSELRYHVPDFRHSLAGMAAVSRGPPSKRSVRTKRRLRHQKANPVLDLVPRGSGVLVVPLLLAQKLNSMRLSKGAVGRLCSLKLVGWGLP
jgi:hypothetical protein